MIRLLIIEDQPGVRKGLQMCLSAEADLSVVGVALDGITALDLTKSLSPDVVLLDVEMPHLDGFETAKALCAICPQAAVVILSINDDSFTRTQAADAGAAAFVAKAMPIATLLTTIREVAQGRLSPIQGESTMTA